MYYFTLLFFIIFAFNSVTHAVFQGWKAEGSDHMKSFVHFGFRNNARQDWMCGGVLITWKHVLTAAHCDVSPENDVAYVGTSTIYDRSNTEGLVFDIEKVESAPSWANDGYNHYDIQIVTLRQPSRTAMKAKGITPIAIDWHASQWRQYPNRLRVIGFGNTENRVETSFPNHLMFGEVFTAPINVCADRFATSTDPREILCFDGSQGSVACRGDSGGPVVYHDGNRWVLVGLVSAGEGGDEGCIPNEIWKATNVEAYKSWIVEKVGRYKRKQLMGR